MDEYSANDAIKDFGKLDPRHQERIRRYLEGSGWLRSLITHRAQTSKGRPLPWYTYGAINFLQRRMIEGLSVFEFGSGQSTLWWAAQAEFVASVEDNGRWYDEFKRKVPKNVQYLHVPVQIGGDYCNAAKQTARKYDVIVIDGQDRENCSVHAPDALSARGVIIWDNSERVAYAPYQKELLRQGFRRVDFFGCGPVNSSQWETAIFYRDGNWLSL